MQHIEQTIAIVDVLHPGSAYTTITTQTMTWIRRVASFNLKNPTLTFLYLIPPPSERWHQSLADEEERPVLRVKEETCITHQYAIIWTATRERTKSIETEKERSNITTEAWCLRCPFELLASTLVDLLEGLHKSQELFATPCNGLENERAMLMMRWRW